VTVSTPAPEDDDSQAGPAGCCPDRSMGFSPFREYPGVEHRLGGIPLPPDSV
jgi:hypothetical protein